MRIKSIVNSFFTSNSWIISSNNLTWLVDCGDVEPILQSLCNRPLQGVLLTHGHFDHIYGLNNLCKRFPGARVYCSEWARRQLLNAKLNLSFYHETPFVFAYPERIVVVGDGDTVKLGDGLEVTAVATPGHTPGCITWMTDDALFTGDAYIPDVRVVTNLPYGNRLQAAHSVELIQSLANDSRTICPGHDVDPSILTTSISLTTNRPNRPVH